MNVTDQIEPCSRWQLLRLRSADLLLRLSTWVRPDLSVEIKYDDGFSVSVDRQPYVLVVTRSNNCISLGSEHNWVIKSDEDTADLLLWGSQ